MEFLKAHSRGLGAKVGILLSIALPAHAQTLHVAEKGDDVAGNGSAELPYGTLAKAALSAQSGDVIQLHQGTYPKTRARIELRGSKDRPITIMAAPGEHVVLDGQDSVKPSAFEGESKGDIPGVLDLRNSSYVIVDGIEVANSPGYGISLWESENVTVRNCTIHHTWSRGLGGSGAHLLFENNVIHDVVLQNEKDRVLKDAEKGKTSYWSSAAATWYREGGKPSQDVVWRGNTIFRSWGEGLNLLHVDGAVASKNTVRDAYSVLIYVDHSRSVTIDGNFLTNTTTDFIRRDTKDLGAGILLASEGYQNAQPMMLENVRITNNIISSVSVGVGFWKDPENHNPLNKYRDITIAQNTIDPDGPWAIKFKEVTESEPEASKNFLVNNILFDGRLASPESEKSGSIRIQNPGLWVLKGNLFPNGLDGIQGHGFREFRENAVGDPALRDPRALSPLQAQGYRPKARSAALGAGVPFAALRTDYAGTLRSKAHPGIGAFER